MFKGGDPLFLSQVILALRPEVAGAGETIISKGDMGREMYLIVRGEVEVLDDAGQVLATLRDGDFFGEIALLIHTPRTATVRAKTACDLFVLDKSELPPHPARPPAVRRERAAGRAGALRPQHPPPSLMTAARG